MQWRIFVKGFLIALVNWRVIARLGSDWNAQQHEHD